MMHHRERSCRLLLPLRKDAPVIERHDYHDLLSIFFPVIQHALSLCAVRESDVPGDEIPDVLLFLRIFVRLEIDDLKIPTLRKIAVFVDDVCEASAHPRSKIASCAAKNDDPAAGHVFAAVIADAFNDGNRTAVRTANRSPATPRMNA